MVTSEAVPFSKSGGLADVAGALSVALVKAGHNVRVLMPLYGFIDKKPFRKDGSVSISVLAGEEKADIYSTEYEGVIYSALAHPVFTKRKGIYGDTSFTPYADNASRYMLFALSVIPYLELTGFKPQIVHCHDWPSGMVPAILKQKKYPAKSIFTIHNLAYQGDFSRFDILTSAITPSERMFKGKGIDKRLNMIKAGIEFPDAVTTVSETYAKEIQTPEQGCGLEEELKARAGDLYGIINGIDYAEWSPETDKDFTQNYSADNLGPKEELKKEVMKEFGLEYKEGVPLFAMISRIAEQKGFPELLNGKYCALEKIVSEIECSMILIGTGNAEWENKLKDIASRHPNLSVNIIFSQKASHRVEGAADLFLMPSRYEPCGLNQLYSMRYGTLPIVHRTGGLADSVIDISDSERGNGFVFDTLSSEEIFNSALRAADFYRNDKAGLEKARKNGMQSDFSWSLSADKYAKLYQELSGGAKQ